MCGLLGRSGEYKADPVGQKSGLVLALDLNSDRVDEAQLAGALLLIAFNVKRP
jgi:hypothetical protein